MKAKGVWTTGWLQLGSAPEAGDLEDGPVPGSLARRKIHVFTPKGDLLEVSQG